MEDAHQNAALPKKKIEQPKLHCGYCGRNMSKKGNLKRHYLRTHKKIHPSFSFLADIKKAKKVCRFCEKPQGNLPRHVKTCSKKRPSTPQEALHKVKRVSRQQRVDNLSDADSLSETATTSLRH